MAFLPRKENSKTEMKTETTNKYSGEENRSEGVFSF